MENKLYTYLHAENVWKCSCYRSNVLEQYWNSVIIFLIMESYPMVMDSRGIMSVFSAYRKRIPLLKDKNKNENIIFYRTLQKVT